MLTDTLKTSLAARVCVSRFLPMRLRTSIKQRATMPKAVESKNASTCQTLPTGSKHTIRVENAKWPISIYHGVLVGKSLEADLRADLEGDSKGDLEGVLEGVLEGDLEGNLEEDLEGDLEGEMESVNVP